MRIVFALIILVGCIRLSLALTMIPTGLPVSHAQEEGSNRVEKTLDEPWLDTVEHIMSSPARSPRDPATQFFNRVMVEVGHHDYEAAAAGFTLFLALHPTSSLAVQADYRLGECAYRLGHYQEAIDAFDDALSRSPLNPKLAAASFLGKANSYAKLGEVSRSRSLLELLVVQFPATEEAAEARQSLLFR